MRIFHLFRRRAGKEHDKKSRSQQNDIFLSKLSTIQSGLISLCMEGVEDAVDKVFGYCSLENGYMFNAFFEKDGEILTLNELCRDKGQVFKILKYGTHDLKLIDDLFSSRGEQVPTEIKMVFDVRANLLETTFKYNPICIDKSAGKVFLAWLHEMKYAEDWQ